MVCGIDIFWKIEENALKYKGKIDVENSVENVDNSLKCRLRFYFLPRVDGGQTGEIR